jgi:hypothetical protein
MYKPESLRQVTKEKQFCMVASKYRDECCIYMTRQELRLNNKNRLCAAFEQLVLAAPGAE